MWSEFLNDFLTQRRKLGIDPTNLWWTRDPDWTWKRCCQHCLQQYDATLDKQIAAVRQYARGDGWPQVTDETKYFLAVRLDWAWTLCEAMSALKDNSFNIPFMIPPPNPHYSHAEVMEWLLIDTWSRVGANRFFREIQRAEQVWQGYVFCPWLLEDSDGRETPGPRAP